MNNSKRPKTHQSMKKLPVGIQSIETILKDGSYAYADKTEFVQKLIEAGDHHYFMSRPRRFGKSLFLDTLGEVFKGNKELFRGCQIYNSDYGWEKHPVVYFDFSQMLNTTPEQLEIAMQESLQDTAKLHGVSITGSSSQSLLKRLILELAKKNQVVVLVDEYDQPVINNLKKPDIAEQNRDIMKNFFGTLKSLDKYLRFTFVTGVTKFPHVSLFSGPNHLTDITMNPNYATMMGYTEGEIRNCFWEHIQAIAQAQGQTESTVINEIRKWYNGYRFSEEAISVYNPYSTLRFLSSGKAIGYWYSTGTPSFLIDQVKQRPSSVIPIEGSQSSREQLSDIHQVGKISLPALMFQTGYLTIQDYDAQEDAFTLNFPNKEVKKAFLDSLLTEFAGIAPLEVSHMASKMRKDLEEFNLDSFVNTMNVHFAQMTYHQFSGAREGFYQAVMFTCLEKSGISTQSEIETSTGRIDLIVEMAQVVCIFELKLDKTASVAFNQAETKNYKEKYSHRGKKILVAGINFSSKSHNIKSWKGAVYSPYGDLIKEIQPKTCSKISKLRLKKHLNQPTQ